jgi:hypothetical protein
MAESPRAKASRTGQKFYYTGKPCIRGHKSVRKVTNRECVDCTSEYHALWFQQNKQRLRPIRKQWWVENKEKSREFTTQWRKRNLASDAAKSARRRATKLKATPQWVDKTTLQQMYLNCPKGYEVDHIIPLVNNTVCGLHVPWNLQYLTSSDNRRKSNNF